MIQRSLRFVVAFAALLAASATARAVELIQPAGHTTLHGGSFAQLECTLRDAPAGAEEWEAFLSLDGGAHYDLRITPHLDLAVNHYAWLVPNVDATDVRILIRTGNERRETILEIPRTFSIRRDSRAELRPPSLLSIGRPEAARPGDAPVVSWAEGDRSGSRGTVRASARSGRQWTALATRTDSAPALDATASAASLPAPAERSLHHSRQAAIQPRASTVCVRPDILLTGRRLNI